MKSASRIVLLSFLASPMLTGCDRQSAPAKALAETEARDEARAQADLRREMAEVAAARAEARASALENALAEQEMANALEPADANTVAPEAIEPEPSLPDELALPTPVERPAPPMPTGDRASADAAVQAAMERRRSGRRRPCCS